MDLWNFNRGEWTEAYVYLKLLSIGKLFGADAEQKKNEDVYLDIESVLRFEELELKFTRLHNGVHVIAYEQNKEFLRLATSLLSEKADSLFRSITEHTGRDGLTIPESQAFLETMHFSSPKAPAIPANLRERYGDKADIIFLYRLSSDGSNNTEGFSIKSYLGAPPTLFNAAEASRLYYRIPGCTDELMHRINSAGSFNSIIQRIKDNKLVLEFVPDKTKESFAINLEKVDSRMLEIVDTALRIECGLLDNAESKSIVDIVNKLAEINPLKNRDRTHFYQVKFKELIFDSFAGLTADKLWNGRKKITGGYIEVDKNGEMLYYRAMSDDVFSSYLYNNTRIVRPDRGYLCDLACKEGEAFCNGRKLTPAEIDQICYETKKGKKKKKNKKCNYGYIFKEGDDYYFTLNFQIRFK